MHETDLSTPVTTIQLGSHVRVIVLRGRISDGAEEELRAELLAAIDEGVKGVVVDLSEADSITESAHEIVRAASVTLDDRGGILLAWRWNGSADEPAYVLAELRDQAVSELVSVDAPGGEEPT
jgi:anti-anti-sigma regulatory factor